MTKAQYEELLEAVREANRLQFGSSAAAPPAAAGAESKGGSSKELISSSAIAVPIPLPDTMYNVTATKSFQARKQDKEPIKPIRTERPKAHPAAKGLPLGGARARSSVRSKTAVPDPEPDPELEVVVRLDGKITVVNDGTYECFCEVIPRGRCSTYVYENEQFMIKDTRSWTLFLRRLEEKGGYKSLVLTTVAMARARSATLTLTD